MNQLPIFEKFVTRNKVDLQDRLDALPRVRSLPSSASASFEEEIMRDDVVIDLVDCTRVKKHIRRSSDSNLLEPIVNGSVSFYNKMKNIISSVKNNNDVVKHEDAYMKLFYKRDIVIEGDCVYRLMV
jgi:hypothetical protein